MKAIADIVEKKGFNEKAVFFGEGNFLRAFAAVALQGMNKNCGYNGSAVCLQGLKDGLKGLIDSQNGLYTVIERGVFKGQTVDKGEIIECVSRCINPYEDYGEFLRLSENPDLEFIVSNTTEFGICYEESDAGEKALYTNFPAKLTDFLYHRFLHFKGAIDKGLLILPCELIEHNGRLLEEYVYRYADSRGLGGEFKSWLTNANVFADTLVDRIVSGYPKAESQSICQKLGYEDSLLDVCEPFFLWVIDLKGKKPVREIPLSASGFDVIFTQNLQLYRTRKVRILNGAHTMSVLAGHMCGLDTVEQLISAPLFSEYVKKGMFDEIIPSFEGEGLNDYAKEVTERFKNPFLNHKLLSIALNSVSKFKTRVLPSILDYTKKFGVAPKILCFSFAALFEFYKKSDKVNDEAGYIEEIARIDSIEQFLAAQTLWGCDLSANKLVSGEVKARYEEIERLGVKKAAEKLIHG